MKKGEIKVKVIDILRKLFPNSGIDVDVLEYVDLSDDLGMDSVTFISLVVEIESVFNVTVSDDLLLMENFKNLDDIVAIIECAVNRDEILVNDLEDV